jgi:hypothetical protein
MDHWWTGKEPEGSVNCLIEVLFRHLPGGTEDKFWEELIASFRMIRHGPHRKRRVQQFLYCCVCICCRGDVFTEPSPSNDRRIHIQTHRLMGRIYEVRHWDWLRCRDIHSKFHKDWFRHSNVDRLGAHRRHGDLISLLLFLAYFPYFEKIKVGLWDHHAVCLIFS